MSIGQMLMGAFAILILTLFAGVIIFLRIAGYDDEHTAKTVSLFGPVVVLPLCWFLVLRIFGRKRLDGAV